MASIIYSNNEIICTDDDIIPIILIDDSISDISTVNFLFYFQQQQKKYQLTRKLNVRNTLKNEIFITFFKLLNCLNI